MLNMQQIEKRLFLKSIPWNWFVILLTGLMILGWLIGTPPGLLAKANAIAYAVCHRIAERSFFIGNQQMPLCARCTGMFLGAMLGLGYQEWIGRKKGGFPSWPILSIFGLFVAAFGIDGLNSYLHLFPGMPGVYEPQNWLRLLTGTGMGLSISVVLFPAFNQTVWSDVQSGPAIAGWNRILALVLLALGVDLLVLSGNPIILTLFAFLSVAGVLVLLSMAYAMFWLLVFKKENLYQRLVQTALPLAGGLAVAMLQIAVLDLIRYMLTGTWDGFHLG
jgi:uncharacterized membrane protein